MWKERLIKINFLSLCLLACFPVLNMKVTVALIIAFTAISIITGLANGINTRDKLRIRELLLLLAPFLLIFFRTYITDRTPDSLFYLEVSMSLVAFPIAFYLSPVILTKRKLDILNLLFVVSTFLIVIFGEYKSLAFLYDNLGPGKQWTSFGQLIEDPSFAFHFRTVFENSTGIHPTYACFFLGISILLLLDYLLVSYNHISDGRKAIIILGLLLFLVLQVQLASRTPFVATMLSSVVLIFSHFRKKIYALYVFAGLAALSVFMMLMVPAFSLRIREISFTNTTMPTAENENSFNIRLGIIKCSAELIKENWLWGVGPGNVQTYLNECYDTVSKSVYEGKNYNTHNQFLDYWAGLGIIGPLILLSILIYISIKNYRQNQPLVMCISIFFIVAMLTENLLSRQNGIVAFAFFIGLYFFSSQKEEKIY